MPCYHPLTVYRSVSGQDPVLGSWPVVFDSKSGHKSTEMKIACGQCIGCRLERSRQWAIRCVHESKLYEDNVFITLTYDNDNLIKKCGIEDEEKGEIEEFSLNKREMQLFIKRLRKSIPEKRIRFFQCGEYGDKYGRPHHHLILFNHDFRDKLFSHQRNGNKFYRSEELESIWKNGMCVIGDVTMQSAAYVARYVLKKVNGIFKDEFYDGIEPEYVTMSRRPGIAREHYEKYGKDYRENDIVVINGMKLKPPRYYDKLYDVIDSEEFKKVKIERKKKAKENEKENTQERLEVKERLKKRRIKTLQRKLEDENDIKDIFSERQ